MRRDVAAALALLAASLAATLWVGPLADERVSDLFVYRSFAEPVLHGGLPYRDVFFEYPPLAAPAIALPGLAGTGEDAYRLAFAGWALLLAAVVLVLTAALADSTGGSRRRALFAVAVAPALCGAMVRTHFDLAPVAITLAALVLVVRGRPVAGLAVLGAGAMTKGFPLVAAPVVLAWLAGRGERAAALKGAAALALVVAALSGAAVAASPAGAEEALRYQADRPIQVESSPAAVLRALDALGAGHARSVNSHRSDGLVHAAGDAVAGAFALALALAVAVLALGAARDPRPRALVVASLAAIAAFAALGKVLSPQYLVWTIPLGALAFAWRARALTVALAAAAGLTLLEFPSRYFDLVAGDPFPVVVVALRDATLIAAVALAAAQLPAIRSWRIAVARPSSPASTSTAFSHGSSSEVSKRACV